MDGLTFAAFRLAPQTATIQLIVPNDTQSFPRSFIHKFYTSSNHYMSSTRHLYSSSLKAFLRALVSNHFFSNPFDRSTPSHRNPAQWARGISIVITKTCEKAFYHFLWIKTLIAKFDQCLFELQSLQAKTC